MTQKKKTESVTLEVAPIEMARVTCPIKGNAPLVMHKFAKKVSDQILQSQTLTQAEKPTKKQKAPRVLEEEFQQSQHISTAGWPGIPCAAFRNALIASCRTVGLVMTQTKMAVFIVHDGIEDDGTPLVQIISKTPAQMVQHPARLPDGSPVITVRAMWAEWQANLTIEFDPKMITVSSVVNLLARAGKQVGILEGRPFSKNSSGMGWGTFDVLFDKMKKKELEVSRK